MAILDVKRLELAKSQLTTEQIFKIKREKFKIKNEIIEIKNTEKPEKESELKLNTREDIDQLIGQLVNAKKLTPEEWFVIMTHCHKLWIIMSVYDLYINVVNLIRPCNKPFKVVSV